MLHVVTVRHAAVAQGAPGLLASTCVLACRQTGEAPPEPWAVAVVPELLVDGGSIHIYFSPYKARRIAMTSGFNGGNPTGGSFSNSPSSFLIDVALGDAK